VVDADQAGHLHVGANLLEALARRRGRWILVIVDKAPGQTPQAVTGLDRAPAEKHATLHLDDHSRGDLGVAPEHETIVGAGLERPAFDVAWNQLGSAVDAVMRHAQRPYACCLAAGVRLGTAFMSATRT